MQNSVADKDSSVKSGAAIQPEKRQPLTAQISYADLVERVAPAVVTVRPEKLVTPQILQNPSDNEAARQSFGGKVSANVRQH